MSPAPKPLVLVVEDDASLRRVLVAGLTAEGLRVIEASTVADARRELEQYVPDVLLLDLGLPDGEGLDVLRALRRWSAMPTIVLSARGQETQKVAALDAGADDYVTKPFGFPELLARVRAALRRGSRPRGDAPPGPFVCGDLRVDLERRQVHVDGRAVALTATEYRILAVLVRFADRVVTHAALARELWGPGAAPNPALRVHLTHLRRKLGPDPRTPSPIETLVGVGYRLRLDPPSV